MKKGISLIDFALIGVTFVWGLNFSVVNYSLNVLPPLGFNALRYILAISFMWLMVARQGGIGSLKIEKKDWPAMVLLALLGHVAYQLLFIIGIDFTKAANASVMLGTIPVWIAINSQLFFEEKLTLAKAFGILLAFVGVITIMAGSEEGLSLSSSTLKGDLIIILAAFCFGVFTLFSKKYLKKYKPLPLTAVLMSIGSFGIILAGIPDLLRVDWSSVGYAAAGGVVYSGLLSIGAAYMIWNYGLKQVGAIKTSAYQNFVPVIGVALGVILLGETYTIIQYIGVAIAVTGIVITRLSK
jgi:drug/metabolite transporter (DMT)-like permease